MKTTPPPEYVQQITDMAVRAKVWTAAHPKAVPLISFPSNKVMLIGGLTDGLNIGLLQADPEGRELLTYMVSPWQGLSTEPTLTMIQAALEIAFQ